MNEIYLHYIYSRRDYRVTRCLHTHDPKEDIEDRKGGQSLTKEDTKEDASFSQNSPLGICSSKMQNLQTASALMKQDSKSTVKATV